MHLQWCSENTILSICKHNDNNPAFTDKLKIILQDPSTKLFADISLANTQFFGHSCMGGCQIHLIVGFGR